MMINNIKLIYMLFFITFIYQNLFSETIDKNLIDQIFEYQSQFQKLYENANESVKSNLNTQKEQFAKQQEIILTTIDDFKEILNKIQQLDTNIFNIINLILFFIGLLITLISIAIPLIISYINKKFKAINEFIPHIKEMKKYFTEENFYDTLEKIKIVNIKLDISHGDQNEQLRAVQIAAQLANPKIVPILAQILLNSEKAIEIKMEALYGLERYKKYVKTDIEIIKSIINISRSENENLRYSAIKAMGEIDPVNSLIRKRLEEAKKDVYAHIKGLARKYLKDSKK